MKILHITPSYEPAWHLGGVVQSLGQLCRGLAKLGHEVTVYATDSGRDRRLEVPVNQPVQMEGVTVYYFKSDLSLKFAYSRALGIACRDTLKNFDLIHMTSFWCYPGIVGGHYARGHGIPYVISTAGTVRPKAMRRKSLKKWLYMYAIEMRNLRQAAAIRCVTEMEREQNSYLGLSTPSFVLGNGIDFQEFTHLPGRQEVRRRLKLDEHAFIGLFVGRLNIVKRLDLLIEAMGRARNELNNFIFLIAGPDGGELVRLKARVLDLGMNNEVKFIGPVSPQRRNDLLAAADFLTLASEEESFGYSAVEALISGLPVIVSEGVGIFPAVQEEEAGIVVPLETEAVYRAMVRLGQDQDLRQKMSRNAQRCAVRHFDISEVCRKMAQAYADILNHRRSPELHWSDAHLFATTSY